MFLWDASNFQMIPILRVLVMYFYHVALLIPAVKMQTTKFL